MLLKIIYLCNFVEKMNDINTSLETLIQIMSFQGLRVLPLITSLFKVLKSGTTSRITSKLYKQTELQKTCKIAYYKLLTKL